MCFYRPPSNLPAFDWPGLSFLVPVISFRFHRWSPQPPVWFHHACQIDNMMSVWGHLGYSYNSTNFNLLNPKLFCLRRRKMQRQKKSNWEMNKWMWARFQKQPCSCWRTFFFIDRAVSGWPINGWSVKEDPWKNSSPKNESFIIISLHRHKIYCHWQKVALALDHKVLKA